MTKVVLTVALMVLAGSVQAQTNPAPQPPPRQRQPRPQMQMQPGDSGQMMAPGMGMGGPGGPDREMLRQRVQERFGQMVQAELRLTEPQMTQLRTAMRANQDRRRDIMRRQEDIQRAVRWQMQPGQAANADSLTRLLNAGGQVRVDLAQSDVQFQRELSFLTPVQQARLMMMMQGMEQRMREIVARRGMRQPMQRMPQ